MALFRTNVLSLMVRGDDLHAAIVQWSPLGARTLDCGVIRGFLSLNEIDRKAHVHTLIGSRRRASRLILVCDPSWCMAKSVGLTPEQWGSARDEVIRSIDRLLPLEPSDAVAGVIGVRGGEREQTFTGGRLVAARRSTVDQWVSAIESSFDRPVSAVLAPEMAMLGLGLAEHEHADILQGDGLTAERHRLRHGVPVEFGGSVDPDPGTPRWSLTGQADEHATPVQTGELAAAAAIAERVAGDLYRPLRGGSPSRRRARAALVAALLLAGIAIGAVGPLREMRMSRALDEVRSERDALVDDHNAQRDVRRDVERQTRLANAVIEFENSHAGALSAIRAVGDVLPEEGVLYRLQIDGESMSVSGEAPSVLSILEELEESAIFTDVALIAPLTNSPVDDALEVFSIHAVRTPPGGAP